MDETRASPALLQHLRSTFAPLYTTPRCTAGRIHPPTDRGDKKSITVTVQVSQADIQRKERRRYEQTLVSETNASGHVHDFERASPFPTTLESIVLQSLSPSGRRMCIFRKDSKSDQPALYIEIWEESLLVKSVPIGDKHGNVMANDLGSLSWSEDEKFLVYGAEHKKHERKNKTSFFTSPASKGEGEAKDEGRAYEFDEDHGEQYTGIHDARLFLLRVADAISSNEREYAKSGEAPSFISEVRGIPEEWGCEHARFFPSANSGASSGGSSAPLSASAASNYVLVFGARTPQDRRLGYIYCRNRPQNLFMLDLSHTINESCEVSANKTVQVTDAIENLRTDIGEGAKGRCVVNARLPSFSPDGTKLCYISASSAFAHASAHRLHCIECDPKTKTIHKESAKVVVDVVDECPESASDFPGLFPYTGPFDRCWLDTNVIALETQWKSECAVILVNVESASIVRVQGPSRGSLSILDALTREQFNGGDATGRTAALLVSCSTPTSPGGVYFGVINVDSGDANWSLVRHLAPPKVQDVTSSLVWNVLSHQSDTHAYESILIAEKNATASSPLLVYPHGGPHSAWATAYMSPIVFLAVMGFRMLLVNYRGSTGFGQNSIDGLCGKCGEQDVADVFAAACSVSNDSTACSVIGGSHGGFLTGHLSGQHPSKWKAAVLRNPVINVASMFSGTDIVEWCAAEANGLDFSCVRDMLRLSEESIAKQYRASPIAHVDNVTVPSLIILGTGDRRVPPFQGREWYYNLKIRDVKTQMLIYDDPHAIEKVENNCDCWINVFLWFLEHGAIEAPAAK